MKLDDRARKVLDHLDVDELVKVALDLGNIDSPTGSEAQAGQFQPDWIMDWAGRGRILPAASLRRRWHHGAQADPKKSAAG